jgi:hypothetical protein
MCVYILCCVSSAHAYGGGQCHHSKLVRPFFCSIMHVFRAINIMIQEIDMVG